MPSIVLVACACHGTDPARFGKTHEHTDDTHAEDTADTGAVDGDTGDTADSGDPGVGAGSVGNADAIFRCSDLCVLGWATSIEGDFDGDDLADPVVGSFYRDADASLKGSGGAIIVYSGPVEGTYTNQDFTAAIVGDHDEGDQVLGLSGVSDVDQDGFDDIIASDSTRSTDSESDGGFFVFNGPLSGTLRPQDATFLVSGEMKEAWAGFAGVADLDGDGETDLVGAGFHQDGSFTAYAAFVMLGPVTADRSMAYANTTLLDDYDANTFPVFAKPGGDLDGDGIDELVANLGGQIGIFFDLAPGAGSLRDPDVKLTNDGAIRPFAFTGGGDIDGDGYQDLLVGVPNWEFDTRDSGGIFVQRGPITASRSLVDDTYARLDGNVEQAGVDDASWAGDVDGDGSQDVLVGAYEADWEGVDAAGLAWLVRGPISGVLSLADADVAFTPELRDGDGDWLAYGLSGNGDANGDGYPDMLLGAPHEYSAGMYTGSAYLFYGGTWVAKAGP